MAKDYGPLAGVRVIEFAGLGPAPFCGMLFSDLGADVVRIDRPDGVPYQPTDVISRGRRSVTLDLKQCAHVDVALKLTDKADILIEGFRPGVMERLGLGPDVVLARKPSLVYGRMTGWGQTGPKANEPGHDINYIALAGALHAIGPAAKPVLPINLVGDFGGGALYLAFGALAALLQARSSGKGQVVDCAMVDGSASLMAMIYGRVGTRWHDRRESNSIDGGSHYYNVYECADGKWIATGPAEAKFYANLIELLGVPDPEEFFPQRDQERWPRLKVRFAEIFKTKTRDEWLSILSKKETCVTPVLSMEEAARHPANAERNVFSNVDGVWHAMPAPRFSQTPDLKPGAVNKAGDGGKEAMVDWGFSEAEIRRI
jgi:alpha-methylacyl-CoA racemase